MYVSLLGTHIWRQFLRGFGDDLDTALDGPHHKKVSVDFLLRHAPGSSDDAVNVFKNVPQPDVGAFRNQRQNIRMALCSICSRYSGTSESRVP